jgi:dTDP-4-dehydrorhamnose reductase
MKAIIVGVDSGVGRALGNTLSARGHQVIGTTRKPERVDEMTLYLNLDDVEWADTKLPKVDVVFFCAAVTSYADCRTDPEMAWRVNVTSPAAIAAKLVKKGTRVILLSTSAVLDCKVPRMRADRPRLPASTYGCTKEAAEVAFLALGPLAPVLRLTKILTPHMKRFEDWLQALVRGKSIRAPRDLRFSPIAFEHVVQALIAIAEQREGGIFQVSGASDISYAEAARYIAGELGVPSRLVEACSAVELDIPSEEVTAYTSLDATRLTTLYGFEAPEPWTVIEAAIRPMVAAARRTTHSAS